MLIPASLFPRIKALQIVAAAMMMGLATFLVIAGFLGQPGAPPPAGRTPVLTYLGLFLLLAAVPAAFVLPAVATRGPLEAIQREAAARPAAALTSEEETFWGRLLAVRQTMLILGMAPLEAAGFFNGVAFIVERDPLALGATIGALILQATRFPTFAGVAAWLHQQTEAIAARRQRGAG
jgi:hypothetical protein